MRAKIRTWASEPSLYARTIGFVVLVCALVVGIDAARVWTLRAKDLRHARTVTQNLVTLTAQHAQSVVQGADAVLFDLRERVEADGAAPGVTERLHRLLVGHVRALGYVHGFNYFDETGAWIVTSLDSTIPGMNYADRPYFEYHRANVDRGLFVGPPVRSKADGSMIVTLSRRVDHPDGRFAGVVVATISAAYFESFYSHLDVGNRGVILLALGDGTVIVRESAGQAPAARARNAPLISQWLLGAPSGLVEYTADSDGVVRIGAYRRVAATPLVMEVGLSKAEVLARWNATARARLAGDGALALLLAALGHRLAVQISKRQRVELLYRLLADHSSDGITLIGPDGHRQYVSPSFCVMTGWPSDQLLGDGWRQMVVAEDQYAIDRALLRLEAGAALAVCSYRCRRPDGGTIWVEARSQLVPARRGVGPAYVENVRDITERRQMEQQLEAANAELARQARTDALTGLANRMAFDQVLAAEWERQVRSGRPLSLLLLDVDHFKKYNDTYGHPAGDAALQAVADCIAGLIRRPGDLAARYGGEEFAVVMPETDADGAARVAEQFRAMIRTRAIVHDGSPDRVVTVSIGLATVPAAVLIADPKALINAADAALYRAKRLGRNRAVADSEPVWG